MKAKRMAELIMTVSRSESQMRGHSDRVPRLCRAHRCGDGARRGGPPPASLGCPAARCRETRCAQPILETRGPITAEERSTVQHHVTAAHRYLDPFADWLGPWLLAATEHHERWDGTDIPRG
ncbi:MAG: HD domain-containing phosphohydrolase [Acidimicrobiales bacterium]